MTLPRFISSAALAATLFGAAGVAHAQENEESAAVVAVEDTAASPDSGLPWYQNFTQDSDAYDVTGRALRGSGSEVIWSTGSRWDFRFGLDSREAIDAEQRLDGVRAGAFFSITPRMRVGGELGYVSRDENPILNQREEDAPQVKVETALRF